MRFILFITILLLGTDAFAGKNDTAIYRRPYYLGFTAAYSVFADKFNVHSPADLINDPESHLPGSKVLNGGGFGLVYEFPFASRFTCEIDAEYFRYSGINAKPSGISLNADGVGFHYTGMNYSWYNSNHMDCRMIFATEVFRNAKFSLQAGLGGWVLAAGNRENNYVAGAEATVKAWIPVSSGGAVQTGLVYGINGRGSYMQLRAAFALKGTRIYRHRPSKYYIRTYEIGE
jgi:hypothetical protein